MTPADLRAWQTQMSYTYAQACAALGIGNGTFARMLSGESKIDKRTALACAALAAGLGEWTLKSEQPG